MTFRGLLAQGLTTRRCDTLLDNLESAIAPVCYQYEHGHLTVLCGSVGSLADLPEWQGQLLRGETVQVCPLPHSHDWLAGDPASLILVCPIMDDQRILGVIRLYRASMEPFSALEVDLVQQVASQSAIALRQARLHEAAQAQVYELERLNRLKDDFLSTVSHELRTPITTIRMAVQMLEAVLGQVKQDAPSGTKADVALSQTDMSKVMGYLKILHKECQRETNLINDLLDLNCLESKTPAGVVQTVVLQAWVPRLAEPFQERCQQQQQQLQIRIPPDLPPLRTNPALLERILTELLQNACKYTPMGETITIAAVPAPAENGTSAVLDSSPGMYLSVSNSGVAISHRDQAHLFDKFYRIPSHDPWKHRGTGLGLALVKRLVEQLSGSIEVTSCDNLVNFTVKLANLP